MPHVWRTPRPDPVLFEAELRTLAPHLNAPVVGKEAIRQWFFAHGFRGRDHGPPSWVILKKWQRRVGEPCLFHAPRVVGQSACTLGQPVSSVLILTRWCMTQSHKIGPRTYATWVPAIDTVHCRRRRARAAAG